MDIWVYKTSKELGDPNAVHLWVEGVVIPFRKKVIGEKIIAIAAPVEERYKPGAMVRDTHNYFVPSGAYIAGVREAGRYFRRNAAKRVAA